MSSRSFVSSLLLLGCVLAIPVSAHAGGLTFLEKTEADGPVAIAISSDGLSIYVINQGGGFMTPNLSLYTRNAMTGGTSLTATYVDGVDSIDGLLNASGVAVSPDGNNVYVTSQRSLGAVVAFTRNLGDGKLTFLEKREDGAGSIPSGTMRKPSAVVVTADEKYVYVTAATDDSITIFQRDLTPMLPADFGKLIYVGVEQQTGPCGMGGTCGLKTPQALALSPDGLSLYVAAHNNTAGSIAAFNRDPLTGLLTFLEHEEQNTNGVQALLNPTGLVMSPTGDHLYVASSVGNAVQVFSRDSDPMSGTFGEITFVETERDGSVNTGLLGAFGIAINPDGRYLYVTGRDDNALSVFRRDATTGRLVIIQTITDKKPFPLGLSTPLGVGVEPGGEQVYVTGSRALTAFEIDRCGNGEAGADEQCDDSNTNNGDGCNAQCQLETCPASPSFGCATVAAEQAQIDIKNDPSKLDTYDQLQFKWNKGNVPIGDFGDPFTTSAYILCVYDDTGSLMKNAAPKGGICAGKNCWKKSPATAVGAAIKNFQYGDKIKTPNGLDQVKLSASTLGKAQVKFKGKGINIRPPDLTALDLPLVAEVRRSDNSGVCWQATFGSDLMNHLDRVIVNDGLRFKAKSD